MDGLGKHKMTFVKRPHVKKKLDLVVHKQ